MARYRNAKIPLDSLLAELGRTPFGKAPRMGMKDYLVFEQVQAVLQTFLECHPDVPDSEKNRIIVLALDEAARKGVLAPGKVLASATRLEDAYLASPTREWTVLTSLSITSPPRAFRFRLLDATIKTHRRLTPALVAARGSMPSDAARRLPNQPDDYTWLTAALRARSPHEAAEKGLLAIDAIRGIWSYLSDIDTWTLLSSGLLAPLNRIRLGPVHTMHLSEGSLVDEPLSYDPYFERLSPAFSVRGGWPSFTRSERRLRMRLTTLQYGRDLTRAFAAYAQALDAKNRELCLVKLWAVLESLTATGPDRAEQTVKRSVFLLSDRESSRTLLQHVRDQRNAIAHGGHVASDLNGAAMQLRRFVQHVFAFHLEVGQRYSSIEEAGEFLGLAPDIHALTAKQKHLAAALRFLRALQSTPIDA